MRLSPAQTRCRTCGSPVRGGGHAGEHYPFCCERCRLVDLSKWLNGQYRIPAEWVGPEDPEDTEEAAQ